MTWRHTNGRIGLQRIDETDTVQNHELGLICQADDESLGSGEFIYALGVASTVVGDWVTMDEALATTRATANGKGRVGVAMSANVASQYGWYQIGGKAVGNALASFADNGAVYLTGTAGSVDDADVGQDFIVGAVGRSAVGTPAAGQSYFELTRPWVGDIALD